MAAHGPAGSGRLLTLPELNALLREIEIIEREARDAPDQHGHAVGLGVADLPVEGEARVAVCVAERVVRGRFERMRKGSGFAKSTRDIS